MMLTQLITFILTSFVNSEFQSMQAWPSGYAVAILDVFGTGYVYGDSVVLHSMRGSSSMTASLHLTLSRRLLAQIVKLHFASTRQ